MPTPESETVPEAAVEQMTAESITEIVEALRALLESARPLNYLDRSVDSAGERRLRIGGYLRDGTEFHLELRYGPSWTMQQRLRELEQHDWSRCRELRSFL